MQIYVLADNIHKEQKVNVSYTNNNAILWL